MLHDEARNLLVKAYEKTHDAKTDVLAYGVSVPTVYRLAEQKRKCGFACRERGRKQILMPEDSKRIAKTTQASRLVFLDESGVNINMARRYGRGKEGLQVVDHAPPQDSPYPSGERAAL